MSMMAILKKVKVKASHKRTLKIKVTSMPNKTNYLGHFALRYRKRWSFDFMTSSYLTFDGSQVNVRSKRSNDQINIFE